MEPFRTRFFHQHKTLEILLIQAFKILTSCRKNEKLPSTPAAQRETPLAGQQPGSSTSSYRVWAALCGRSPGQGSCWACRDVLGGECARIVPAQCALGRDWLHPRVASPSSVLSHRTDCLASLTSVSEISTRALKPLNRIWNMVSMHYRRLCVTYLAPKTPSGETAWL